MITVRSDGSPFLLVCRRLVFLALPCSFNFHMNAHRPLARSLRIVGASAGKFGPFGAGRPDRPSRIGRKVSPSTFQQTLRRRRKLHNLSGSTADFRSGRREGSCRISSSFAKTLRICTREATNPLGSNRRVRYRWYAPVCRVSAYSVDFCDSIERGEIIWRAKRAQGTLLGAGEEFGGIAKQYSVHEECESARTIEIHQFARQISNRRVRIHARQQPSVDRR